MTDSEKNEKIKRKLLPSLRKLFGPKFTPEDEAKLLKKLEKTGDLK